tara:strand:+ start:562 stop:885 length:324 start_codon:yes stop_codon:yes gene_type:complete
MNYLKVEPEFRNGYKDKERMKVIHSIPCSLCIFLDETQRTVTTAHHRHGYGAGKKTSDLLAISLCDDHHQKGPKAFHKLNRIPWEEEFGTDQIELLEITNELLKGIE